MTEVASGLSTTAKHLMAGGLRGLFIFTITPEFFLLDADAEKELGGVLKATFADLEERFGARVLGTLDDDLLGVGSSEAQPISYILAELPDFESGVAICNLLRTRFNGAKLARYLRVDVRIGHPLFFGDR